MDVFELKGREGVRTHLPGSRGVGSGILMKGCEEMATASLSSFKPSRDETLVITNKAVEKLNKFVNPGGRSSSIDYDFLGNHKNFKLGDVTYRFFLSNIIRICGSTTCFIGIKEKDFDKLEKMKNASFVLISYHAEKEENQVTYNILDLIILPVSFCSSSAIRISKDQDNNLKYVIDVHENNKNNKYFMTLRSGIRELESYNIPCTLRFTRWDSGNTINSILEPGLDN